MVAAKPLDHSNWSRARFQMHRATVTFSELKRDGRRPDEEVWREKTAVRVYFRRAVQGTNAAADRRRRDGRRQNSGRMRRDADQAMDAVRTILAQLRVDVDDGGAGRKDDQRQTKQHGLLPEPECGSVCHTHPSYSKCYINSGGCIQALITAQPRFVPAFAAKISLAATTVLAWMVTVSCTSWA
jgi:hypothetical protein